MAGPHPRSVRPHMGTCHLRLSLPIRLVLAMIQKDGKFQELVCDECGDDSGNPFQKVEFGEMIASAKDAGWQIELDNHGVWRHYCPTCRDDHAPGDRLEAQMALFGRSR